MLSKMAILVTAVFLQPVPQTEEQSKPPQQPSAAEKPKTQKTEQAQKPPRDDLRQIELNLVSYTNAERARRGLPPLKVDTNLMKSARGHASWMARSRRLVHTRRSLAENIAMGQSHSSQAVRDWMNSPGHRANILNRAYRRIGVAAYRTTSGTIYWCQQFLR